MHESALAEHPFLKGIAKDALARIATLTTEVNFTAGQTLCHEGARAHLFFLLTHGDVALTVDTPRGPLVVETLDDGDVIGWSWAVAPHRWRFTARARSMVRAFAIDGDRLRALLDADPALGYLLFSRLMGVVAERLSATRMQLIDVYGGGRAP
jgi:CRP/FNR family cyclic AMP-dependent transcriptional regulator